MAPQIPRCPFCGAEYFACKTDDRGICVKRPVGVWNPSITAVAVVIGMAALTMFAIHNLAEWLSP